jgi:hypothetical protein
MYGCVIAACAGATAFAFFHDLSLAVRQRHLARKSTTTGAATGHGTHSDTTVSTQLPLADQRHEVRRRGRARLHRRDAASAAAAVAAAAPPAAVARCGPLPPTASLALNMARLMRARGRSRRAQAAARSRGAYMWGGMYR